ncbi:MAG: hypothetical protein WAM97_02645, partial [Acidimicrobiales bacterium]
AGSTGSGSTGSGSTGSGLGSWVLARALAEVAGMIVSPGDFYGETGPGHVRIALVQPDVRLDLVAERFKSSDHPHLSLR